MFIRFLLLILISSSLTSCIEVVAAGTASSIYVAARDKTVGDTIGDSKIHANLLVKFREKDVAPSIKKLNIEIYEGRVLLTGRVKTKEEARQAVRLAWKIKGVKEVINEISVNGLKNKRKILDFYLAAAVKQRLIADRKIKSVNIEIAVSDKVVYLLGELSSRSQVRRAATAASKVKGVQKVVSHIRVI